MVLGVCDIFARNTGRNPAIAVLVTLLPIAGLAGRNRVAEHSNGNSGAGLRQRVLETKYVEALGVLVVSAARHRSWEPSSPNAAALTTLGLWSLEGVLHPHTPLGCCLFL